MKQDIRQRIAVIDYDKCNPVKCGNWLCEKVCPVNRTGKECIVHEKGEKPSISEDLCIGCLICEKKCPFGAISIVNLSIDLKKPIHSFGSNLFRLHRLPLPRQENVVGLVGSNGIGKSTALKILSAELVPNFGEKQEEASWDKVIEFFRGREEQSFFEKIKQGRLKASVKPQAIDSLPQVAKGKVRDLLERVDEGKQLEKIAKQLEIGKVMEQKLSDLSGGELQKVAIAAASLKQADLYFFDEPSSYLDISQRMKVGAFIRKLAGKGKSVIVVEHDLILLDYLSDFVHLMYGKPAVFGIVSQVKTTREGINTYLEGYSRDENYRFRPYEIEFSERHARKSKQGSILVQWPEMGKKLGKFKLSAGKSSINRNEVIGILGPNATGKTTFVKMLAGEIKPDNCNVDLNLKVAYKQQYLTSKSNETVREMLEKDGADLGEPGVLNNVVRPLAIDVLMEKSLGTLSGGELQRAAIASTLLQKSDLILMDEPSAHLDVEQRLAVAKAIRNIVDVEGKSALIVDHDLLFMDYIADRLMVFSGRPAEAGKAEGPFQMEEGMNRLLKQLGITVRRDKNSKRPRVNKLDSVLDREQKEKEKYYYA
ncbi:MAG: ribosome biogenesis/translation initiation ATPase RLI [Candidatus Diapherotrites archaeon]|uniref:Ribosome biogenesis/translation initiation ATPase RLI n=1 Tax=Candidatus Iainarchaeum sp. TaxID=3101447 RepID=A0A938YY59_9ARCH|nr:ribosome biogenesis/translation initiation ATPase RLI [Candidatus Diapherotrites archaeon]